MSSHSLDIKSVCFMKGRELADSWVELCSESFSVVIAYGGDIHLFRHGGRTRQDFFRPGSEYGLTADDDDTVPANYLCSCSYGVFKFEPVQQQPPSG